MSDPSKHNRPERKVSPETQEREARPGEGTTLPSQVVLLNDDYHTFEEVIMQLMKAVGCSPWQGYAYALEVHTTGRAVVYHGALIECLRVADVLREIQLGVNVEMM